MNAFSGCGDGGLHSARPATPSLTFFVRVNPGIPRAGYVLYLFQKKSKRGIATPKHEIDLVKRRLAQVVELEAEQEGP